MIINALNNYYDILSTQGKVLKSGYSNEKAHFFIELSENGELAKISNCKIKQKITQKNGKTKEIENPRDVVLPKRTEKPGIESNIIEHRPLYIFGLNSDKVSFSFEDKTNKAKKSHDDFVTKNLEFLEGLDSTIINAYRLFIQNWTPEAEQENQSLLNIVKEYPTAKFAFCLEGHPEILLHEDELVLEKWSGLFSSKATSDIISQCAITGEMSGIARIHDKIKGVAGANATGAGLIVFNNPSDNSYGNDQSYNSNISESVMKRYTEALNFLLSSRENCTIIDDITVVHFAMSTNDLNNEIVSSIVFGDMEISDYMDSIETQNSLRDIMKYAKEGQVTNESLSGFATIDKDVDYYMIGFKPNSSRLSVKFVYKQKVGEILKNIAQHQQDLKVDKKYKSIPFWQLKEELLSPKRKKNAKEKKHTINPALSAKIWHSVLYGTNYPESLMQTVINRVKLDSDTETNSFVKINHKRIGILKACINRKLRNVGKEEEITMGLNLDNTNQAYLCGRLFAVYEKIQQEASNETLNRTIKDSYFSVACAKPASVFPKIAKLSHFHLKKLNDGRRINLEKLIGSIMNALKDELPDVLAPSEQGKFIVGYYQQNQDLYTSKQTKEEK